MASDRSRISYDEGQQYRSVVMQQGRVLTDSDLTEAQEILAEETRREALDFVGPSGTPDDGYKISFPDGTALSTFARSVVKTTPFAFAIGGGTMYVGGVRVSMSGPFTYDTQPEWIKPPSATLSAFPADELVWLELIEHEVSALEDPALLEVALGGPDTAQRTRIVQRIHRAPTTGTTCADVLTFQEFNEWITEGRIYDDATKRLLPRSMLKVGFSSAGTSASPCDPAASGGYSGAENRLIRVRIVSGTQFVWSYDNASSLYRVDHVTSNQLFLTSMPVDVQHQPRQDQVVELLRGTMTLPNGGTVTEAFGPIMNLSAPFDPINMALTVGGGTLSDEAAPSPPLFVRIWEAPVTFNLGRPVDLPGTGLQVTIIVDAQRGARVSEGDFWTFAVRPGTPSAIYPQRYSSFQPPEGPRRWACSLGVIHWSSATQGAVVSDCRDHFDNLVALTSRTTPKSCCLTIDPSDLVDGSFQTILDANSNVGGIKFCLLPGIYNLSQPIVLTPAQSGIEFEACRDGVTISGGNQPEFADGIVQIEGATGVTFRGIQFSVRVLPARGGVIPSAQPQTQPTNPTNTTNTSLQQNANLAVARQGVQQGFIVPTTVGLGAAIGIRAIDVRALTIEDCQFLFPDAADVRPLRLVGAIGAAVLLYGQTNELILRRNSIVGRTQSPPPPANAVRATIAAIAMIPAFFAPSATAGGPGTPVPFPPTTFDGTFFSQFSNAGFLPQAAITPTVPDTATPDPAASTQVAATPAPAVPAAAVPPANARVSIGAVQEVRPPAAEGTMLPAALLAGDISNNHFTGCASAAFLCGDTGFIRIIGNDVTDASNGFQLIATRWVPEIAFLDATTVSEIFQNLSDNVDGALEKSAQWNAVQAVAEPVAAMMHPANVWMATALMSLSLPSTIAAHPNLVVLNAPITDHSAFLQHLIDQVQKFFVAGTSILNPPSTAAQANLTKLVGDRIRALWGTDASPFPFLPNQVLSEIAFGALQERSSSLILALQCSENVVDVRTSGAISGTALLVLDSGLSANGSAVVSANRFSNASLPLPTAAVALVSNCTLTGNLVQNEQSFAWPPSRFSDPLREFWSLILVPGPRPHDNLPVFIPVPDPTLAITPTPATALPLATSPTPTGPPAAGSQAAKIAVGTDQVGVAPIGILPIIGPQSVDASWIPPLVAVTGNVFKGYPVLPPRFMPGPTPSAAGILDPFNTWLFLNTVSW
ncbi:MAG TPA: DUF6519 domain-containing protein [Thermoanaerobaculia bacterium]|jgi:hypothetical protein|nr:DUF6519 domain-containing protein [Thermoanaerobaculia bacterium]